ncbi:MAG: glycoside hydrolase family 5 protein [Pseudomonadota bacterium]
MRHFVWVGAVALAACSQPTEIATHIDTQLYLAEAPIERCINLGNALEAPNEGEWGYVIERSHLDVIKQAGFDTVRLPVRWSGHADLEPPYTIDPTFLARVDEVVGWAEAAGLKVIVNVHHYGALNEDPDTHEPRLEALWDQLSSHFAGVSHAVIFETLNEPHAKMTTARTDALNQRVLSRLRQDHPDRWVILGTAFWSNLSALEESRPAYDPRVMLTVHNYSPMEFTHQGASWTHYKDTNVRWGTRDDVTEMMTDLDKVVAVQERLRMPVFVGEFGVYEGAPMEQRARWTRAMREGLEARNLSWCYWDFAGALKAYDVDRAAWLPELNASLLD